MQGLEDTIRGLRKARIRNQTQLANAAGITQQSVSDAERNDQAGRDVLIAIARAFDRTVDALLREAGIITPDATEPPAPIGGELARLWPHWEAIPEWERKSAL